MIQFVKMRIISTLFIALIHLCNCQDIIQNVANSSFENDVTNSAFYSGKYNLSFKLIKLFKFSHRSTIAK